MPDRDPRAGLFPALLRHWRGRRGMSQLDLALAADVSARHVSFLETGRSSPSAPMVLRLATTLGVPLRHVDAMLAAAGHPPVHGAAEDGLPPSVVAALEALKAHQEPFPLVVVDRVYRLRDVNRAGAALLGALMGAPAPARTPTPAEVAGWGINLARTTFDPAGAQPHLANFHEVGRALLWRIQREVLEDPDDGALRALLDEVLAMPTVDPDWRDVDLAVPSDPALVVHLRGDAFGGDLRFLTLLTAFQAPQAVAVEDLRIELWLPSDEATATACRRLAG